MTPTTNDGSGRAPRLRLDLNLGTLGDLPAWSAGPRGDARSQLTAIRDAGFEGVQGGDLALCRELDLGCTAGGRVDRPEEAMPLAERHAEAGYDCTTLHVGTGFESEAEIDELVGAIVEASAATGHGLYIETHRATITTDIWRSVQFARRHPEVRFNGDFSHWYTGHEMVYGDWEAKLAHIAPVLERVRYCHGRIGNPGCMQVAIVGDEPYVEHFRELWTRAFEGFLATAGPGDWIGFAPEILMPKIYYARVFPGPDGEAREESDRWQQALRYAEIARECFNAAQRRSAQPA